MRYRLKKDLPFAKKGDGVIRDMEKKCYVTRDGYFVAAFQEGTSDWIEEVKEPKGAKLFCSLDPDISHAFNREQIEYFKDYASNSRIFNISIKPLSREGLLFMLGYLAEYLESRKYD